MVSTGNGVLECVGVVEEFPRSCYCSLHAPTFRFQRNDDFLGLVGRGLPRYFLGVRHLPLERNSPYPRIARNRGWSPGPGESAARRNGDRGGGTGDAFSHYALRG